MELEVRPATPETWPDVAAVMDGPGDPGRCWCQYFLLRGRAWQEATTASNRAALRAQVEAGHTLPPGLVAYDGSGDPVGWCQTGPKVAFPRLASSPASAPDPGEPDPAGLWATTCFVVPPRHRRHGVARALLEAAVAHARRHGATAVEGYPVDVAEKGRVSSAGLYHGTLSMFLDAGFTELRRPSAGRVVVRRIWTEADRSSPPRSRPDSTEPR